MIGIIKKNCLAVLASIISFLAIFTVNSACTLLFGQEKEPKSLSKYKKFNK
ncbi:cyclic lactone autoinducer peptide [Thomasclavelia sp.]|uniref:cyclic lactone autoinducer peptide n=1 Tax=Thomasclavelia sp. TaxID=3025757 RepID=UPI0025D27850|nr:cyclic lactone autoinducer peptide [Thomasclavelia sp.]